MLNELAKVFMFVVCYSSKSFSVVAILIYFWFLLQFWCHSALGDFPQFKNNQQFETQKNVTLLLEFFVYIFSSLDQC